MWIDNVVASLPETANILAFVQLVAVVITALATWALWRATRVLADETKTLAAMTSHAFVVGTIEKTEISDHTILNFVLRNTGNATAFDVSATIHPAIPNVADGAGAGLEETVFKLTLLPPGQRLAIKDTTLNQVRDKSFELEISWSLRPGGKIAEPIRYFIHGRQLPKENWGVKGLHNIAQELERLRKQLKETKKDQPPVSRSVGRQRS